MSDMYRESLYEGGIPAVAFTRFATLGAAGLNGIDDQAEMALKYPLMNVYWRNKIPDFSNIVCPMYVGAGWNHFHLRGSVMGWRLAGSKEKWLRAHREFEWPDYYTPENIADLKLFFDRYCKGIHNGWELTPRVRIDVQDAYDELAYERRPESEFPLARTEYRKLYLDAATMSASYEAPAAEASVSYDANEGQAEFDCTFAEDTEITGYLKLRTWVEARGHDDMDLFVTIKKIGSDGVELPVTVFGDTAPHPGAWGKMRVSHRELDLEQSTDFQPIQAHERELKLAPGEIVPIDVEINPTCSLLSPHRCRYSAVRARSRYPATGAQQVPHFIQRKSTRIQLFGAVLRKRVLESSYPERQPANEYSYPAIESFVPQTSTHIQFFVSIFRKRVSSVGFHPSRRAQNWHQPLV